MANQNLENMNVAYTTKEDYNEEAKLLEERFSNARPIPGTQKYHAIIPVEEGKVLAKTFSFSVKHAEFEVSKS